jgi:hypothetical protein
MEAAVKIPLEPIASSLVGAAGYDAEKQILAIQFAKTGTIKHYAGVALQAATDFYTAASKGQFLTAHIFNKHNVERMTGPCPKCGSEGWIGDTCADCGTASHAAPEPKRVAP